jgi:hypothetical protein
MRSLEAMALIRWTLSTVVLFLLVSGVSAEELRPPDPLFQSDEIIDVRIEAPLRTILSERPFDEELPATFSFTNSAGEAVTFDIKMRTRGKFRRKAEVCHFPPMRLNFKASQTKGTLFQKQDKVKLVTHCQSTSKYEQSILREYMAYRILNVMTDASYRVRLLRISYFDTEGKRRDQTRFGFIIEHRDRLAKRLDMPVLEVPKISSQSLQREYASTVSIFQYLIGNTDFSSVKGVEGEPCCHNHVLFGNENEPIWSIPYDFDQAGLVDAEHAGANPRFRLRNVRQRLYRGRCSHNDRINTTLAKYNDKHDEILRVIANPDVAAKNTIKKMTKYVEQFYKTINNPRSVNSELIKNCI